MAKKRPMPGAPTPPVDEEIPFVPAFDLLAAKRRELGTDTIIAIGTALFALTSGPDDERHNAAWESAAKLEAITRRF